MMIFGQKVILCRGKKAVISIACLLICLPVLLSSCLGHSYQFRFSSEELETDLLSFEAIEFERISDESGENVTLDCRSIAVFDDDEAKAEVVETLSEIEFVGWQGVSKGSSNWGVKLNYPDKYIVFSEYTIYFLDENYEITGGMKKGYHKLGYMGDNEAYMEFLDKYLTQYNN